MIDIVNVLIKVIDDIDLVHYMTLYYDCFDVFSFFLQKSRVGKKPGFFVINRKKTVFWFKPGFFGFYGFNGFYGFFSVCIFL